MERALLMIIGIVFAVAVVGALTVLQPSADTGITANVVRAPPVSCERCTGTPVCAAKDNVASNYPSACAAECDGAQIIVQMRCEKIPVNGN